jgi:hypothetical protein
MSQQGFHFGSVFDQRLDSSSVHEFYAAGQSPDHPTTPPLKECTHARFKKWFRICRVSRKWLLADVLVEGVKHARPVRLGEAPIEARKLLVATTNPLSLLVTPCRN